MINEKIVNTDDYDRFMIDENNLLKILIDTTFYNPQEQLRLNIIRIQTQSEENVRKEKKMMIMH